MSLSLQSDKDVHIEYFYMEVKFMKTKFLRFGKRTLSIALSVLMIVSTMLVGNIGVTEVSATDTTQLEYFLTGDGITTFEGESAKWISNYKNDYNSDQQWC